MIIEPGQLNGLRKDLRNGELRPQWDAKLPDLSLPEVPLLVRQDGLHVEQRAGLLPRQEELLRAEKEIRIRKMHGNI